MKYLKHFFIAVVILTLVHCSKTGSHQNRTTAIMAYYVPNNDSHPEDLPLDKLTHIIFSFTKIVDNEMVFTNDAYDQKLRQLVSEREKHPNLKIMIACGGWGSKGFSDMAYTYVNRQKFIKSVINFNTKYQLDGIDIDWEYPTIPAANTKARPEDKQNFSLLTKELREALNTLNRKQTLTFASAGWKNYYKNIELQEVMKYVNYMNIMTYDLVGSSSPYTGHHTALGQIKAEHIKGTPADSIIKSKTQKSTYELNSAEMIVDYCINKGVKPEQIVLGSAFYSRTWKGVPNKNNGLYQTNKGSYVDAITYSEIRAKYEKNKNFERYWDTIAKAPYLFNKKDSIFISYDDTVSVRLKTSYVKKHRLGGIMFWQLSQDTKDSNSLLDAIYQTSLKEH
ncbi:glycoside hydrolase family 18 protein [Snuella sedimenti]|uniref:chitinase n=1 Tax=Snuella sedimenti TaxID=2798802 RepID=A0A8J7IQA8_9FLAO|nr:glycoside hydrolase family 18 protein [Snuella sedimenti]MBJ6369132.1 glycoside hydrolase family 18 protein [Snuella sedimenti]